MFGKLGRAGGGGGRGGSGKRPLPPPIRAMGPAASASRIGGSSAAVLRRRDGGGGPGPVGQVPEETFSMVSSGPLDFASIIRLTPDLVDEIRRAEERGGAVRIKFDSNSNGPSGNVINVDGKEFRFTWSREFGDLCDIYEEQQNGENGNGLLSECGSAWRKLNVQRILDESLKNHVKMRSEEAERQLKARRAIVLDLANPSVKNQSSAAVEGSMRRMQWKRKKEPPTKKLKTETQAPKVFSSKPVPKSRASPNLAGRGGQPVSPLPSPPEKTGTHPSASPNLLRELVVADVATQVASNKEENANPEKEGEDIINHASHKVFEHKGGVSSQPVDLRSMLITLLLENPKGITLKALEKAVRDTIPNSIKKIENVLKNVANFQAPGRYFLKPGVETESSNRPLLGTGSSPDSAQEGAAIAEATDKTNIKESVTQSLSCLNKEEESDTFEKTDKHNIVTDPFAINRKNNDRSDERAHSSSESGSDSESESDSSDSGSDSGSQSRSRSKSKSPVASGSGSSSDSDSDVSSSSKETDVDVDITSDDEKVNGNRSLAAELKLSSSSGAWIANAGQLEQKDRYQLNGLVPSPDSSYIEIDDYTVHADQNSKVASLYNKITSENPETATRHSIRLNDKGTSLESTKDMMALPSNKQSNAKQQVNYSENLHVTEDIVECQQPDIAERTKSKSKRPSEMNLQGMTESAKRRKASESLHSSGNTKGAIVSEETQNESMMPMISDIFQDINAVNDSQPRSDDAVSGKHTKNGNMSRRQPSPNYQCFSNTSVQDSGNKHGDLNARRKFSSIEKSDKGFENLGRGTKHGERIYTCPEELDTHAMRNTALPETFSMPRDKNYKDTQDEDACSSEKTSAKSFKTNVSGERSSSLPDSRHRKSGEQNRLQENDGHPKQLHGTAVDNLVGIDDKGITLRREFSELEAGEFREPFSLEDTKSTKGQAEPKDSPKSFENKANNDEDITLDISKGRTSGKLNFETKRKSPSNVEGRNHKSQDGFQRKSASSLADSRSSHWSDAENLVAGNKNLSTFLDRNMPVQLGMKASAETKNQKTSELGDTNDQKKDYFRRSNSSNGVKRMESSEGDSLFFSKFEKDEPELRGPILTFLQYKEYIQEYEEKYECYVALNAHMEKIRHDFLKIGGELPELSKGRDIEAYSNCCRRIMKFHREYKMRVTRLKKTFTVLHEELTTLKHRIKIFAEEYSRQ